MATLTVWKFAKPEGAAEAAAMLEGLRKQHLIDIYDAAIVEWPVGKKRPKTRQAHDLVASGALGGAFWGMLFGILFFMPLLGLVIGAAAGALSGGLTDVGINDEFIDSVRETVTPGTSALFLLSDNAVTDRVRDALSDLDVQLIHTNLSREAEQKLRAAFEGGDD